jgi:hypothetical protein
MGALNLLTKVETGASEIRATGKHFRIPQTVVSASILTRRRKFLIFLATNVI